MIPSHELFFLPSYPIKILHFLIRILETTQKIETTLPYIDNFISEEIVALIFIEMIAINILELMNIV